MLPAKRGEVGEEVVRHVLGPAQRSDGLLEIAGVPQDDSGDDQVEAGCPVLLVLVGAVTDFSQAVDEHGARQAVARLAFVQLEPR